jgi:hypothetical protein
LLRSTCIASDVPNTVDSGTKSLNRGNWQISVDIDCLLSSLPALNAGQLVKHGQSSLIAGFSDYVGEVQGAIPDPCTYHRPEEGPGIEFDVEGAGAILLRAAHCLSSTFYI